jgi:tight adherence protein C
LLTDGADTSSRYGAYIAADIAKQAGALVYTIGLGPDANDGVLTGLAEPSGGKYYKAPSPADLGAIYNAISIELDSQLFLKYKSTTRLDRSYQLIHVEVKYTSPSGQVVTQQINYRPRVSAAVVPAPSENAAPAGTTSQPEPVILPPRLQNPDPVVVARIERSLISNFFSLGAALLASFAALCGTVGLAFVMSPSLTSQRVARYVAGEVSIGKEEHVPSFVNRVLLPWLENLGKRLASLSPKGYTDHVEELLTLTGPPYQLRLASFLGMQVALSVALMGVLVLWALATAPDMPVQWMLAGLLGAVMGVYFPYFWLKRKVTRRQRALLRALPGALDFLAINVEAGLGFDAAIAQVVQRWRNTLTDELALLLIDFQIGKARKDAWRDLMLRTQVPELNSFVTAMLQNEQVGSSIGTLLRTQADQMRIRRRQAAEEAARTAPVKMLLPMVFFIFPGIFVVILGPAIPQFINTFSNLSK